MSKYENHESEWREEENRIEEQNAWCRTCVSTWTQNTIEEGGTPSVERFMIENEEWDYDHYIDIVEAEINRVSALCAKEEIGA